MEKGWIISKFDENVSKAKVVKATAPRQWRYVSTDLKTSPFYLIESNDIEKKWTELIRVILFSLVCLLMAKICQAQGSDSTDSEDGWTSYPPLSGDFNRAFFPGGDIAFYKYLQKNTHIPKEALRHHIDSFVAVIVIFDTSGNIIDSRIKLSLGYGCDEEALRVVRKMPPWNREKKMGEIGYVIPIWFPPKKVIKDKGVYIIGE